MSMIRRVLPRVLTAGGLRHRPWASHLLLGAVAALSTVVPPFNSTDSAQAGPTAAVPASMPVSPATTAAGTGSAPPAAPELPPPPPAPATPPPPAPATPPPAWAAGLPPAGVAWAPVIQDAAAKVGLDPRLLASVVWVESAFNPTAASPKGALGLAQVMPTTAADLRVNPYIPVENLNGGARYLKHNLDRFGKTDLALAAYNAGPRRVAEAGGIPAIDETRQYVTRVLDTYRRLGG